MSSLVDAIKKVREALPGIGLKLARDAYEIATTVEGAIAHIKENFKEYAVQKERKTSCGKVFSYVHHDGSFGVLVKVLCETDFVARTEIFQTLGHDLCLQMAADIAPEDTVKMFEEMPWVKDSSRTVKDLLDEVSAKTGEKIVFGGGQRMDLDYP
jgi:elongation factor Ts